MCKGCKLYAILAFNEKGVAEGLEHLPVVKEFADVFPKEFPGMPPERKLEFTRPEIGDRTDSKNTLSDVDPRIARVKNATEEIARPGTDTS
jgi:hypothetical protein